MCTQGKLLENLFVLRWGLYGWGLLGTDGGGRLVAAHEIESSVAIQGGDNDGQAIDYPIQDEIFCLCIGLVKLTNPLYHIAISALITLIII